MELFLDLQKSWFFKKDCNIYDARFNLLCVRDKIATKRK